MASTMRGGFLRDDVTGALVVSGGAGGGSADVGLGDVETQFRSLADFGGSDAVASGIVLASRAVVRKAGTYGNLVVVSGQAAAAVTDLKYGVWNEAGDTLLASTAASQAIVTAANTRYQLALLAPVALTLGQVVYIGCGGVGTTIPHGKGANTSGAFATDPPVPARTSTGWAGGALPAVLSGVNARMSWYALRP